MFNLMVLDAQIVDVDFLIQNFAGDEYTCTTNKGPVEIQIGLPQEKEMSLHKGD
jgi:hypothetical protein